MASAIDVDFHRFDALVEDVVRLDKIQEHIGFERRHQEQIVLLARRVVEAGPLVFQLHRRVRHDHPRFILDDLLNERDFGLGNIRFGVGFRPVTNQFQHTTSWYIVGLQFRVETSVPAPAINCNKFSESQQKKKARVSSGPELTYFALRVRDW